ncbi:MAG: MG2 domain-containing protein [Chitinophagaceae bacterium]|nr:MG2 domain-containing protein [Chitinophagaceae bacterium]
MKHIHKYFLLLMAGFFLFSSCKRKQVSLVKTNARGEVPLLGNLVFRFSHSLVSDSLLQAWDSTEYISFEPAIKGKFRWQAPDELVFSPAEPLSPATTYRAKIRSAVLRYSGFNNIKGAGNISFHTPLLQLNDSRVIWVGESSATAVPQLDLLFNYRVDPGKLKNKLTVETENVRPAFNIITAEADNIISLRLQNIKTEDKEYDLKLILNKGLKPEKGNTETKEDIRQTITLPSPYTLTVQSLASEHDGTEGMIKVYTSQQLSGENPKPYIKIEPEIPFQAEITDYGFVIRSDKFDTERSFNLTLLKGLRGKLGGQLREEYHHQIAFGELEPSIRFTSKNAMYLSRKGGQNLEVKVINVPEVKVVISKIYENNLLNALQSGYYPQEKETDQEETYETPYIEEGEGYSDYVYTTPGDVIYEKKLNTRSLPKSGAGRLLNLSQIEDQLPEFKGIYHIMVRSTEDYWLRDSRFISVSDLGLIARQGKENIHVFVNSLKNTGPVAGVNLAVYGANNQLLAVGKSNNDGVAVLNLNPNLPSGFKPAMIVAKTTDDFNFMIFNNSRVNTSRFDVGGKRRNAAGLDAFVYAERDVYRPGETILFSVILRDAAFQSPGELPLKLRFLLPNGKELKTLRKTLNEEGSLEAAMPLSLSAITGTYTLEVFTSNDVLLASRNFSVEEFMPDRIRVNAEMDKAFLRPGDKAELKINAVNFFGPPASGRKYETEIVIRPLEFKPEKYKDYDFSLSDQNMAFEKQIKEGMTDESGNASFLFEVPPVYKNNGLLQAGFYTTVFDETGRPVNRIIRKNIYTQDVFLGIKKDGNYYYALNRPIRFQLMALDKDGNPVSSPAKIKILKTEYRTVLAKSGSYYRYESQRETRVADEQQIIVGANTVYSFTPRSPGDYELQVSLPDANPYVRKTFYSYGGWSNNNAFEVNREGNIEISLNKEAYYTGETVEALFKTPFNGKLLVTLERENVITYKYLEVVNRTAKTEFKLSGEHVPNVYITATLIKPHELSDMPLTVAHGFINVKVEEKNRRIPVQISAPKISRSKTRQKVTVQGAPGSLITLAAVDNGILQISDFKTPDPYNYFYSKKALQVTPYDIYPLLFEEVRSRLSSTGGDGYADMEKRVNPMPAKRVKLVSYWSGIRKANSSGMAEFDLDIPAFNGELRLMAVSYKGNRFGASDATITVADPIVISTALPRFLSPGDTVTVPVTLTNTTANTASVSTTVSAEGPVKIIGSQHSSLQLAAKKEGRVVFRMAASPEINTGKITVTVNGLGEKFSEITEIAVRPPSTLQQLSGSGSIEGGSSQKIKINLMDFIPSSVNYTLVVSRSPIVELGEQMKYLMEYPYGCTEQVISSAFPQLYYSDISELIRKKNIQNAAIANQNVVEAIRIIKMRQLYNGAVTLWDGTGTEDWWTTAYAAHFLLEAQKAGFDVEQSLLSSMLNYLNQRLRNRETVTYYYNRNQNKKIAPKEVAYSLYVLALANRSNIPAMNYYKANNSLLALDSRYLLAATYALAGDRRSFQAMLPASFSGEKSVPQTGGSFYSDVRDEALALNVLLDTDPSNPQIPVMVKHVAQKLKSRTWLSTQERSFAFLALGKHARAVSQSDVTAEIRVNGKTIGKADEKSWKGDKNSLGSTEVEILTKGKGKIYYFWNAEGISSSGAYKEEDSYLKVRKMFFDRYGKAIQGYTFKQNELIIVGITLEKSFNTPVENIVITDLLPAGFEIENPRTKEIPGMEWIKDAHTPEALDVRDDRIHFFVNAYTPRQTYYYAVRAVSPGVYKMGPVSADAMYNGEYHSYHGAGLIRIVQ